jgi:hypothetical protein
MIEICCSCGTVQVLDSISSQPKTELKHLRLLKLRILKS